ncbi:MAG: helix-turn-helix transcriptional regulator [Solirubrobacteraceae bacterium]
MGSGSELFERDGEYTLLGATFDACVQGRGGVLLIEGEAGIGKSALLAAGERLAQQRGLRVLRARGAELEDDFAFGVMRQLVEREVQHTDPARRKRLMAGAAALAGPALAPAAAPPPGSQAARPDAMALQHGLYWLLANLAEEQPLIVSIDDLHWADAPTVRFLIYLARRLGDTPIVVLGGVRSGEHPPTRAFIDTLRQEPTARTVELQPLGIGSVGRIVGAAFGRKPDPSFVNACLEVSGGNPFLASELVRTLATDAAEPTERWVARVLKVGPTAVTRSVLVRLARVPHAAAALARAVAMLGQTDMQVAAALAGLTLDAAVEATDQLVDASILALGEPLTFRHPLVRSAIYAQLPARRRAADHKRAGRLLADHGASIERVAGHLLLTNPESDAWVSEVLAEAAERALMRGAPEPAVDYLTRCTRERPPEAERATIVHALGSARFLAGDANGSQLLLEALEHVTEPSERTSIVLELASMLAVLERAPEAVQMLDRELTALADDDARDNVLRIALVVIALFDFTTAEIVDRELPKDLQTMTGATADERLLLAAATFTHARSGTPAIQVAELAERAWASGALIGDLTTDVLRALYVVTSLLMTERFELADAAIEQLLEFARRRGSLHALDGAASARAILNHRLGRLEAAEASVREALAAAGALAIAVPADIGILLEILAAQGRFDAADAELERAAVTDEWVSSTSSYFSLFFLRGRARLRLAKGELDRGLADILELGRRCELMRERNPGHHPWRSEAAIALLRLGETADARRLAAHEVTLARSIGAPSAIAAALRAHGLAQGGSPGLNALQEAASIIEHSPCTLTKANVLVDLGAALRRANQRSAARQPLTAGLKLAQRCGAAPLAEHATDELRTIGILPSASIRAGHDVLTPAELRVCTMASRDMSNPQIAQALFVTRGTIESQLHVAYRKLGINSRKQLRHALQTINPAER